MNRLIALIGAFDRNGVFGIGSNLPWSGETGRSLLKLDMGRFVQVTRDTLLEPGKQNVLVLGRESMEAMGWNPLPKRHTIVLSQRVSQQEASSKVPQGKEVQVARNVNQALEMALSLPDCGNVFFGGGKTVWMEALKCNLCNAAFITMVGCDTTTMTKHSGEIRKLPEMLQDNTFVDMKAEHVPPIRDMWDETEVELHFRNYLKA